MIMSDHGAGMIKQRNLRFPARSTIALCAVLLIGPAVAAPGDNASVVRDLATSEAERDDIAQTFNRYVIGARDAGAASRIDCKLADRQLADLERSVSGPSLASVI